MSNSKIFIKQDQKINKKSFTKLKNERIIFHIETKTTKGNAKMKIFRIVKTNNKYSIKDQNGIIYGYVENTMGKALEAKERMEYIYNGVIVK